MRTRASFRLPRLAARAPVAIVDRRHAAFSSGPACQPGGGGEVPSAGALPSRHQTHLISAHNNCYVKLLGWWLRVAEDRSSLVHRTENAGNFPDSAWDSRRVAAARQGAAIADPPEADLRARWHKRCFSCCSREKRGLAKKLKLPRKLRKARGKGIGEENTWRCARSRR